MVIILVFLSCVTNYSKIERLKTINIYHLTVYQESKCDLAERFWPRAPHKLQPSHQGWRYLKGQVGEDMLTRSLTRPMTRFCPFRRVGLRTSISQCLLARVLPQFLQRQFTIWQLASSKKASKRARKEAKWIRSFL